MKIAIISGETSGDNYGALLAENIRKIAPETFLLGTGGREMRERLDLVIEGLPYGKMGFSGILTSLPLFYRSFRQVKRVIEKERPSLVILIDNPGFNLKVAGALGKKFPCFYYIPPKIWAHNYGRIKTIRKYIKGVISVFPFEEEIYGKEGVPCRWFGHPATDLFSPTAGDAEEDISGNANKLPVIGLLPGSRREEIQKILPVFIRLVRLLREKRQVEVLLSASDGNIRKLEESILKKEKEDFRIAEGKPHGLIRSSSVLLAASGTVNLEVALMEKPLMVFYKTSAVNYLLARIMVKLTSISPINLMLGEKTVPEYIQRFPYGRITGQVLEILDKGPLYRKEMESFLAVKRKTGGGNVSARTAEFLLEQAGN